MAKNQDAIICEIVDNVSGSAKLRDAIWLRKKLSMSSVQAFRLLIGLPVMSNFLEKSKDQYFSDPDKFAHFQQIFDTINRLSVSKNYYNTDLFNIENILSILELQNTLTNRDEQESFVKYIQNVIEHCTPPIPNSSSRGYGSWFDVVFGERPFGLYKLFVSLLLGYEINSRISSSSGNQSTVTLSNTNMEYSVISLNYDMLLENLEEAINSNYDGPSARFRYATDDENSGPYLAKLHGSVDTGEIIPPTWSKHLSKDISLTWQLAYRLLSEANHIRILGYSLPLADSYLKYLFRAASTDVPHLKRIDVLCLDPTGHVKKRYDDFIAFNNYRFLSRSIEGYFEQLKDAQDTLNSNTINSYALEVAHANLFI